MFEFCLIFMHHEMLLKIFFGLFKNVKTMLSSQMVKARPWEDLPHRLQFANPWPGAGGPKDVDSLGFASVPCLPSEGQLRIPQGAVLTRDV